MRDHEAPQARALASGLFHEMSREGDAHPNVLRFSTYRPFSLVYKPEGEEQLTYIEFAVRPASRRIYYVVSEDPTGTTDNSIPKASTPKIFPQSEIGLLLPCSVIHPHFRGPLLFCFRWTGCQPFCSPSLLCYSRTRSADPVVTLICSVLIRWLLPLLLLLYSN